MITSNHHRSIICNISDGPRCNRTKYSITMSGVLIAVSTIALALFYREEMTTRKSLVLESTSMVLYGHAVVMITSLNGPATNYSTMYFSTWAGAAVSVLLMINSGHDKIKSETVVPKEQSVEVFMDGRLDVSRSSRKEQTLEEGTYHNVEIDTSASKDLVEVNRIDF